LTLAHACKLNAKRFPSLWSKAPEPQKKREKKTTGKCRQVVEGGRVYKGKPRGFFPLWSKRRAKEIRRKTHCANLTNLMLKNKVNLGLPKCPARAHSIPIKKSKRPSTTRFSRKAENRGKRKTRNKKTVLKAALQKPQKNGSATNSKKTNNHTKKKK